MKIINVRVDGNIKIVDIFDTCTQTSETVGRSLKIPTGNYKDIIFKFDFVCPLAEGLHLFAMFKASFLENPIEVEITNIEAEGETYQTSCFIPGEVLQEIGKVELGIYGYNLNEDETLKKRISLEPIVSSVVKGSYDENAINNIVLPTPTIFEVYFDKVNKANAQMQANLEQYENKINELFDNANENLKKIKHFNSVAEMKACTTLIETYVVMTLGYYEANDGGGATYLIREKAENDVEDNGSIHFINEKLVAELIIKNNTINFKQFGAKSENDTNFAHIDCKPYLQKYLNYVEKHKNDFIKLYIPSGIWCFSETCINTSNVNIIGDLSFYGNNDRTNGTIITSLNQSQRYVWKLGGNADFDYSVENIVTRHINIDFITFSSGVYTSANIPISLNEITKGALYIDCVSFSHMPTINFNYIYGTPLGMSTSWELYFNILNFREIYNHSKPCISFDEKHNAKGVNNPNISAVEINSIMFEVCNGDYINIALNSGLDNCIIHHINAECSFGNGYQDNGSIGSTSPSSSYNINECFVAGGQCSGLIIESINTQLIGNYVHTLNNTTYVRDEIIAHKYGDTNNQSVMQMIINNIYYEINNIPIKVIAQHSNIEVSYRNRILINNIVTECYGKNGIPVFDLKKYNSINVNNILARNQGNSLQLNNLINTSFKNCYDYVVNNWEDNKLITDNDCINPLKVACKKFNGDSNSQIINIPNFVNKKIKIRMKIPNGTKVQVFYKNGETSSSFPSVTGTGQYAWYEFDFTDINIVDTDNLILSIGNIETYLDCFYFE